MAMELSIILKEENMWETGNKIKCMEGEYFIILTNKWHMMENGRMINFLALEPFTMNK